MGTVVTMHVVGHGRSAAQRAERESAVERAVEWFEQVTRACSRFDAQRKIGARPSTCPGGALVESGEWQSSWRRRLKLGLIESGGGESGFPIHRVSGLRVGLHLVGDGLQVAEPALGIQNNVDHA